MNQNDKALKAASPYSAVITREQFLFYEMRTTAKLIQEGLKEQEIVSRIETENLFQYPTEKMVGRLAVCCLTRLKSLNDPSLIEVIANQPSDVAKQVCLYAMMKQYNLVWDFMITVVGAKYSNFDMSFGKRDLNEFMLRLQEQDNWVATWSDATVTKIKQVLMRVLIENEYLDSIKAEQLNPVLIAPVLEDAIRASGNEAALPAFNCLS